MDGPLEALLDQVRAGGAGTSRQDAARVAQRVLGVLGAHLDGGARADLALVLPYPCGLILADAPPADEPLATEDFIREAAGDVSDPVAARRAVTAVLAAVADVTDDALLRRMLAGLPPGHAVLFGRMEPA
ncbi:DUF2267 domain-containing protein [Streptomyces sp. NPDC050560]|uniref:DUF2267 domain-containing protein n=1 Tax=Streptomyces sp. NPDC050560 TaxID=3365630 RepID=UPI0037B8CE64